MADNYDTCGQRLVPHRDWQSLVLSGGLLQNCPVLRELIVNKFGCPHRISETSEETFRGLLLLALVASGKAASVAMAAQQLRAASS